MKPTRSIRAALCCLTAGLFLSACGHSTPTGPGTTTFGDTYITVNMDGVAWKADRGTLFMKGAEPTSATETWYDKSQLTGLRADSSFIGFELSTIHTDSLPLGNAVSPNVGTYRVGNDFYFTQSGYLKITKIAGNNVEGRFECEMVASSSSSVPGKVIKMTGGKFLAYQSYAAAAAIIDK